MIREFINKVFQPEEKALPTGDEAWSGDSSIYARSTFEKYNPDALVGRKGFSIYRKMMLDEQVKAVVKFKRDAITNRDFIFELDPIKNGLSEEEAKFRTDLSYATIDEIKGSFTDKLNNIMSAIYNGFSMSDELFRTFEFQGKTWWGIEDIKLKPYDTFYFNADEFGNVTKLIQKHGGREREIDLERMIYFVMNPDFDEHYGQSELREVYRSWFSKDNIIKFRNIWLEKHAGGFRTVKPTDGSKIVVGSQEYTDWQNILNNINSGTGIIAPANREIISEYPSNNVAYREAIEDCDISIARGLLVPNLLGISPQGEHGSLSQADSQIGVFMWTLKADSDRLADTLNEQLFKRLGRVNFKDGIYPKFKFKPISSARQQSIIESWKELVDAKAVTPTKADERHIRDLMDFPEATKDGEEDSVDNLNPKMDGAQVSSILEVLDKVRTGALPHEAAVRILILSFPLDEEAAKEIVDEIEVKEPQPIPPQLTDETDDGEENDDTENDDDNEDDNDTLEQAVDSTVIGKGSVSVSAFNKAIKRVDFAVIGKTAEDGIEAKTAEVTKVLDSMYDELVSRLSETEVDKVSKIKYNPKLVTKLRRRVKNVLNEGWKIGEKHAVIEIDKAKGEQFKASAERLEFIGEEFFNLKSFSVTGNLTENTLQIFKNTILNGIKTDKSLSEVRKLIYSNLASAGYLSVEAAKEALGAALGVDNPDARINTIVRTNTFESINEARYNYFTDPSLGSFVQAMEYSSILDSRTTSICEHLDGQVHAKDSDVWVNYRPPNHYNCRSLLVPVTELDAWSEDDVPTIEPQRGFE